MQHVQYRHVGLKQRAVCSQIDGYDTEQPTAKYDQQQAKQGPLGQQAWRMKAILSMPMNDRRLAAPDCGRTLSRG
jgi:hypothetical protein